MPRCTVAIPVVHVSSAEAAAAFFRSLGFEQQFVYRADQTQADPSYMGFTRDDAQLHVSSFAGVSGGAVYIWVDDLDALHQEFVGKDIPIIGPFDQTWGTRELSVRDGDHNTFCFGQRRA
jgi:catechol 2,3-dioxygenase-like lactoylglutathione lyase family enzyme